MLFDSGHAGADRRVTLLFLAVGSACRHLVEEVAAGRGDLEHWQELLPRLAVGGARADELPPVAKLLRLLVRYGYAPTSEAPAEGEHTRFSIDAKRSANATLATCCARLRLPQNCNLVDDQAFRAFSGTRWPQWRELTLPGGSRLTYSEVTRYVYRVEEWALDACTALGLATKALREEHRRDRQDAGAGRPVQLEYLNAALSANRVFSIAEPPEEMGAFTTSGEAAIFFRVLDPCVADSFKLNVGMTIKSRLKSSDVQAQQLRTVSSDGNVLVEGVKGRIALPLSFVGTWSWSALRGHLLQWEARPQLTCSLQSRVLPAAILEQYMPALREAMLQCHGAGAAPNSINAHALQVLLSARLIEDFA